MGLLEFPSESLSTCRRMEGDSSDGRKGNPAMISLGHSPPLLFSPAFCCCFILVSRSAIYCYRTGDHTLSGFQKHTFIISQLPWVRSPGLALLGTSHRAYMAESAGTAHLKAPLEKIASELTCLLAECSSLWPIGMRVSVFCWLIGGSSPQFLAGCL